MVPDRTAEPWGQTQLRRELCELCELCELYELHGLNELCA